MCVRSWAGLGVEEEGQVHPRRPGKMQSVGRLQKQPKNHEESWVIVFEESASRTLECFPFSGYSIGQVFESLAEKSSLTTVAVIPPVSQELQACDCRKEKVIQHTRSSEKISPWTCLGPVQERLFTMTWLYHRTTVAFIDDSHVNWLGLLSLSFIRWTSVIWYVRNETSYMPKVREDSFLSPPKQIQFFFFYSF